MSDTSKTLMPEAGDEQQSREAFAHCDKLTASSPIIGTFITLTASAEPKHKVRLTLIHAMRTAVIDLQRGVRMLNAQKCLTAPGLAGTHSSASASGIFTGTTSPTASASTARC